MSNFGFKFGQLIARKREDRGWSLAQLAIEAYGDDGKGGESRKGDVQKLEAGASAKPNASTIRKFRLALELSQEEIDACRSATELELAKFADKLFEIIAKAAEQSGVPSDLAISLSERYAEGKPNNFNGALKDLEAALETAAQDQVRGTLPSNLGEAVDDIVRRIDAMNKAGDIDAADDALEADLARRRAARERQNAEDTRILEKAIAQATYTRNANRLAERTLELVQLSTANPDDQLRELRLSFVKYWKVGVQQSTPFAIETAVSIAQKCTTISSSIDNEATAHNDLAVALSDLGNRLSAQQKIKTLQNAAIVFQQSRSLFADAGDVLGVAMVENNLGELFRNLGACLENQDAVDCLTKSNCHFRTSLETRTEEEFPDEWAETQNNLGNTLADLAQLLGAPNDSILLAEAGSAFRSALQVRTKEICAENWAQTTNNLATIFHLQGIRASSEVGLELLTTALEKYQAVLAVRSKTEHPRFWAETRSNLAMVYRDLANHDTTPNPRPHLETALTHVDAALAVYDPEHMSQYYEQANRIRDHIRDRLAALD